MQVFNINDEYFKYSKCLSGITYQYVNQLDDIYEKNLMVGTNYCVYMMYNEFDIINNFMVNLDQVDVCSTTNLDITQRFFQIDNAALRKGHKVLLVSQTNKVENNIYTVDSRGYLIVSDILTDTGKTWRYKAYVKLGDNKGKQFHLKNTGNRFPLSNEKKDFLEGHGYIIKNYFNYDIKDNSGVVIPKLVFADYELARVSVNENATLYSGFEVPEIYNNGQVNIKYHDENYLISISGLMAYTGLTIESGEMNITGVTLSPFDTVDGTFHGPETRIKIDSEFTAVVNDYLKIQFLSGGTTGVTVYELKSFVKSISGSTYIFIDKYIPENILNNIHDGTTYSDYYKITNLMYSPASNTGITGVIMDSFFSNYINMIPGTGTTSGSLNPKEYSDDKYFDYDGFEFIFNTQSGLLTGHILDKNNLGIITGAKISSLDIAGKSTISDEYAYYELILPYDVVNNLKVESPSGLFYKTVNTGVTINSGEDLYLDIFMEPDVGIISGVTYDSFNYTTSGATIIYVELSGVTVEIEKGITGTTSSVVSDSMGLYALTGYSGSNIITGSLSGYNQNLLKSPSGITIPTGSASMIYDMYMKPPSGTTFGTLSGVTYDESGSTLSNVLIVVKGNFPGDITTSSSITGEYSIQVPLTNYPSENDTISTYLSGYTDIINSGITIRYNQIVGQDIILYYKGMKLNIVVSEIAPLAYNGEITYLSGSTISLSGTSLVSTVDRYDTVTGSGYTFDIIYGGYTVECSHPDYYTPLQQIFQYDNDNETTHTLTFGMFHLTGSTTGYVTGVTSAQISGVTVSIVGSGVSGTSGTSGLYNLTNIRTGYRNILATKQYYNSFNSGITITTGNIDLNILLTSSIGDLDISGYTSIGINPIVVNGMAGTTPFTTGSNGYTRITNILTGTTSIIMSTGTTDYYVGQTTSIFISGITNNSIVFYLDQLGDLTGTVKDIYSPYVPLSGAIFAYSGITTGTTSGTTYGSTTTNGSGIYSVSKLQYGNYTGTTTYTNYSGSTQYFAINSDTKTLNYNLYPSIVSLSGTVTNFYSSVPIQNATVTLSGTTLSGKTDSNGYYSINNIPVGTYSGICTLTDYFDSSGYTNIIYATNNLNFTLKYSKGILSGYVTDIFCSSRKVGGVKVEATGSQYLSGITNSLGYYELLDIPNGTYILAYSKTNYTTYYIPSKTLTSLVETQDINITPHVGIATGYVTNSYTSAPISGAQVVLNSDSCLTTSTNIAGYYSIPNIPISAYTSLYFTKSCYENTGSTITISVGTTTKNIQMVQNVGSVSGRTTDYYTGNAITGVTITAYMYSAVCSDSDGFVSSGVTNGSGYFNITHLPLGSYYITVIGTSSYYDITDIDYISLINSGDTYGRNYIMTPKTGTIYGTVKECVYNNNLPGVTINIDTLVNGTSVISDGSGNYSGVVRIGLCTLSISDSSNYSSFDDSFVVNENEEYNENITLSNKYTNGIIRALNYNNDEMLGIEVRKNDSIVGTTTYSVFNAANSASYAPDIFTVSGDTSGKTFNYCSTATLDFYPTLLASSYFDHVTFFYSTEHIVTGNYMSSQGSGSIVAFGICWVINSLTNPTLSACSGSTDDTAFGMSWGNWWQSSTPLNITPNDDIYYFRSYITTSVGISYSAKWKVVASSTGDATGGPA